MFQELERNIAALKDTKTAWITRRDAADFLGEVARKALGALKAFQSDSDTDVRSAVQKALEETGMSTADERGYTLEHLASACAKVNERRVAVHGAGYAVEVRLQGGRHQLVYLLPETRKESEQVVRLITYCGKPSEGAYEWALQANMKFLHGALALEGEGDQVRLVLTDILALDTATPEQVKQSVKELAFYGDWMEQRLTGKDQL